MSTIICSIAIPAFDRGYPHPDNIGPAAARADVDAVEELILAQAGGFTVSDCEGAWLDDNGRTHRGPVRLYRVANFSGNVPRVLRQLAASWGALNRQECVYVEIDGRAELIEPCLVNLAEVA